VADKLATLAGKIRHRKDMKRVIEAEFFSLNFDRDLSPPVSIVDAIDMIAPASALAAIPDVMQFRTEEQSKHPGSNYEEN
jgi:hypothetical protein